MTGSVIRLHLPEGHYDASDRRRYHDIPKLLEKVGGGNPAAEVIRRHFALAPAEAADVWMLPMWWNHYVDTGRIGLAKEAGSQARQAGRPLLVFSSGDFTAHPRIPGSILFQMSVNRSRREPMEYALPAITEDRTLAAYPDGPPVRQWRERPLIGFCGQVGSRWLDPPLRVRWCSQWLQWWLGLRRWEPPRDYHFSIRRRALRVLALSPRVDTAFVCRTRYRGGVSGAMPPDHPVRSEFLANMANCDYALCVRGAGNWSRRFYEALMFGRVPLLVDTDCMLPFEDQIPWQDLCVRVPVGELNTLADRVAEFHARLNDADYAALQYAVRATWLRMLSADSCYGALARQLRQLLSERPSGAGSADQPLKYRGGDEEHGSSS